MEDAVLQVAITGPWRLQDATPRWNSTVGKIKPSGVRLTTDGVPHWDTSLVVFVGEGQSLVRGCGNRLRHGTPSREAAPAGRPVLGVPGRRPAQRSFDVASSSRWARTTRNAIGETHAEFLQFIGECWIATRRLVTGQAGFRWADCLGEMQKCGAMALPIVSLINLVGITLAYSGAIVLKRFGADIWVADLIGVAMTREMGAMMVGVVLAGRTGASFAAEIGSMKVNQEIDALKIIGISPVRFLVLPRILALGLMMPLLALYANCLGILGGMAVAYLSLDIPPTRLPG